MLTLDRLTWVRLRTKEGRFLRSEFIYAPIKRGDKESILILGGIDEKFHLSNKILELELQIDSNPLKNTSLRNK